MAKAPNENIAKAKALFDKGMKLIDISKELDVPAGTVRRWKSTYKWDGERSGTKGERSPKKKGGQPNNKNAVGDGAPKNNKNAEKHGFFSKWLPEETAEIMQAIEKLDPLDILWDNIQLQYTAIIRAQKLMFVKDQQDVTRDHTMSSAEADAYQYQHAWDKQATFLQAQSRAMKTLEGMIKQYDEMLNKNWELVTEEQKARIDKIRVDIAKSQDAEVITEDDGFIDALKGDLAEVWDEED